MVKKKLDPEMQQFQADLLQSVRDMKDGRTGRTHQIEILSDPEPAIQKTWINEAKDRHAAFDLGEIQAHLSMSFWPKCAAYESMAIKN